MDHLFEGYKKFLDDMMTSYIRAYGSNPPSVPLASHLLSIFAETATLFLPDGGREQSLRPRLLACV